MTRERFRAMLSIVGLAFVFGIPLVLVCARYHTPRAAPTHIEACELRYLDPSQFKTVECEADGVTWPPRADGGCYAADKPERPPYSTAEAAARCLQYDKHGELTPIPNCMGNVPAALPNTCAYYDGRSPDWVPVPCQLDELGNDKISGLLAMRNGSKMISPDAQPSDVIEDCLIPDPKTNTFHSVDCAELVGSIAWRKQHGLYPTPMPDASTNSGIESGTASLGVSNGIPPAQPCEMYDSLGKPYAAPCGPSPDPGPMQGQWMAERGDHCTINGYTDVLCDNPCDTTGISLKEWETYSCTVDALDATNITTGCLVGLPCDGPNPDTPPAVIAVPLPDYNSEELEQDDNYNHDINEGRQI